MTFRRLSGRAGLATVVLFAASIALVGRPQGGARDPGWAMAGIVGYVAGTTAYFIASAVAATAGRTDVAPDARTALFVLGSTILGGVGALNSVGWLGFGIAGLQDRGLPGWLPRLALVLIAPNLLGLGVVVSDADLFSAGAIGVVSVAGYSVWVLGTSLWLMRPEASPRPN